MADPLPPESMPHGGQKWRFLDNFVTDFSVTTNALGPPADALEAARDAISQVEHYPAVDFEPALGDMAAHLWGEAAAQHKQSLILGNGASELIDLVIRDAPRGAWKPGKMLTQYKEYERSARADGRETVAWDDRSAALTCMVNPTNPTGDYWDLETMQAYALENCRPGSALVVDESMLPWLGPSWREQSLAGQGGRAWVAEVREKHDLRVWVITSWTKIWACPGLRIGSVVAPSDEDAARIRARMVPWSVNTPAIAFISVAVRDRAYMERTWEVTSPWRARLVAHIERLFPSWKLFGAPFLPWLWVDTGSVEAAESALRVARAAGFPIRHGRPGYDLPTFIRLAVREPEHIDRLARALAGAEA